MLLDFLHKHKLNILIALCVLAYSFLLIVVKNDPQYTFRWITFSIYILTLLSILTFYLVENSHSLKKVTSRNYVWFGLLLLSALFISFAFLKDYPYIGLGDEVRDSGLNAISVIKGNLTHFFDYGDYDGFGNIIPVISSFFYWFFGSSVYTYRVPAALISILDIILLFTLLRQLKVQGYIAFAASLAYASLALHMFYGRTELVVAFDSFWATSILLVFFLWFKKGRLIDYILLGTVLGFAANFHSSTRILSLGFFFIAALTDMYRYVADGKKVIGKWFVFVIFCFIGFGPAILFSNQTRFFQENKTATNIKEVETPRDKLLVLESNYAKSLMVWFYEPAMSHFPGTKPLFPPLLGLLFVLGLGYAYFVKKSPYLYIISGLIFALPLTNSAITDTLNADHRLMTLLPVGALFFAFGLKGVIESISDKKLRGLTFAFFVIYVVIQAFTFFSSKVADKNRNVGDYLIMNAIYTTQSTAEKTADQQNLCVYVSPDNFQMLDLMHYKEQFRYFLPNFNLTSIGDESIPSNEVYVKKGECSHDFTTTENQLTTECNGKFNFKCPQNYHGQIVVHY